MTDTFEQMKINRLLYSKENVHRVIRERAAKVAENITRSNALMERLPPDVKALIADLQRNRED